LSSTSLVSLKNVVSKQGKILSSVTFSC
jgi:hypothetical protein